MRVYDDALLVIGAGGSARIGFSFAGAVGVRDYAVTVEVTGREPVILTRLGRRAGELAELLATGSGRRAAGRPRSSRRCCPGSTRWPCAPPPDCSGTAWPSRPPPWTASIRVPHDAGWAARIAALLG